MLYLILKPHKVEDPNNSVYDLILLQLRYKSCSVMHTLLFFVKLTSKQNNDSAQSNDKIRFHSTVRI